MQKWCWCFVSIIVLCVFLSGGGTYAAAPYRCGSETIQGAIQTSDLGSTTLKVILSQSGVEMYAFSPKLMSDGTYTIPLDYTTFVSGTYTIISTATLGSLQDTWTYESYIGTDCPTALVDPITIDEQEMIREKLVSLANEVADFKQREENTPLSIPIFLATGGPFQFIDATIKKLGLKFASSKSSVYHDLPSWTVAPDSNSSHLGFMDFYSALPESYKYAKGYLQFKGLFVPINISGPDMSEKELLTLLNQGIALAPQTKSLHSVGTVKLLYAHALSFDKSPFAGIGSYISVFSEIGDEVIVYTRSKGTLYDTRRYTIKAKLQVKPEQTTILEKFNKPGADSIALVTCKDGNVLGSTAGREITLLERRKEELGKFQLAVQNVGNVQALDAAKKKIDAYLHDKDLDEKQVTALVKKLEDVEKKNEGKPLAAIITYGKYMAAYDAVYNDGALGG